MAPRPNNTITRKQYDRGFTVIANDFLRDANLSWKAKGIISSVQMLPDNWVLNMRDLQKRSKDGRDSLQSGIKELEKYGYCRKTTNRNEDGTISGVSYEITDKPIFLNPETENPVTVCENNLEAENPQAENPETGNPSPDNPPLLNTNSNNNLLEQSSTSANNGECASEKKKARVTLFCNSEIGKMPIEEYVAYYEGKKDEYKEIDLVYYRESIDIWSDKSNTKRTNRGWIATLRDFIRRDASGKGVKKKSNFVPVQQKVDQRSAVNYINGYD